MNQHLQALQDLLAPHLPPAGDIKERMAKLLENADKEWTITEFKLKQTEKVKRTTATLLEETIQELEEKRKAVEAQNREAQIEAALERVRASSLAMHHSEELELVVKTVANQLTHLGISLDGALILFFDKEERSFHLWIATNQLPFPLKVNMPYEEDMQNNPIINELWQAIETGGGFINRSYTGKTKNDYFRFVAKHNASVIPPEVRQLEQEAERWTFSFVGGKHSVVGVDNWSGKEITPDEFQVLKRFANVFEQAYTRFLDLQKAEALAKEAKVEAALERVRARAMAMHSSEDLAETIQVAYQQLAFLNLTPRRCGISLLDRQTRIAQLSAMNTTEKGDSLEVVGTLTMTGHPVLEGVYNHWLAQTEYHPVLRGEEIEAYYRILQPQIALPNDDRDAVQYGYFFFFPEGTVYTWTTAGLSEEVLNVYRRFTSVLSLTYKRYREIKQAEINAREAVKQAALDRIRADIASMRTVADLDRITPLVWSELTVLRIPFIRCGVFLMDDEQQRIHTFLSTPEGRAIAAFHLPYATPGRLAQVISHWRNGKSFTDHWDEKTLAEFANSLAAQKAIASAGLYMSTLPAGGFYLHFLPFLQGMLYVGTTSPLGEEDLALIGNVADAFSTAYARYEDFKKLEAAKQQVENTLKELRATQAQLVQAEKMASLGELTAGIAHEIQNPLNFVNNFSSLNRELLQEMRQALEKGNVADATAIAHDLETNEEKIFHHGNRADGIVKSMLQHSRVSTGEKQPTDLNALADEYLRLSYQGMRARDNNFAARIVTDFDAHLGDIPVVPQDFGRVLLNLYNNAFYAVSKKKAQLDGEYQPEVFVGTKRAGNQVHLTVRDNGTGIPLKARDKIFQPFFTTKPTGEGTGLGLSLSYDIITKGHGGQLKVETKEGEGAAFIITLAANGKL